MPIAVAIAIRSLRKRQVRDLSRQVRDVNEWPTGERVAAFEAVLQFANIPGPIVGEHSLQGIVAQHLLLTGSSRHAFQKMTDQQRDVLPSFPQSRNTQTE